MFIQMNCCPPNKRYDLMDANKKVDLEQVQWDSLAQFWHNLKEADQRETHKDKVDTQIPDWMITEEMKHMSIIGYEMILQDTLQVSLAEHKSPEKSKKLEKIWTGQRSSCDLLEIDKDGGKDHQRMLEPRSDKESPEVEIIKDKEVEPTNDEDVEITNVPQTTCRPSVVRPRDQDDPHDDASSWGVNSCKLAEDSDDDEIPTKQMSQDIKEEVSLIIDEAKLKKMADEMLRQRCTSGDEHQYHIDQMNNFLKSDIISPMKSEYLKLFEEEIEVRLKYQNQMRRWEMYVNGRPLGPRRERPE
ncbi:hypothetical protein Tco_0797721 [Tanacetum coccineum]